MGRCMIWLLRYGCTIGCVRVKQSEAFWTVLVGLVGVTYASGMALLAFGDVDEEDTSHLSGT